MSSSLKIASCANDFKHVATSDIKRLMNIYCDFYILDKRNEIFAFELHEDGRIRIVENPWYEGDDIFWSNTYDTIDDQDKEINPWTIMAYPIQFSTELKDILDLSPIR